MTERPGDGCTALREIAGQGEWASAAYVARRRVIESRHAKNDDGTETLWHNRHGERSVYEDDHEPITLDSPVAALEPYGFTDRMMCWCDRCGIYTVGELRLVLRRETWRDYHGIELATAWRMGQAYSRGMIFGR